MTGYVVLIIFTTKIHVPSLALPPPLALTPALLRGGMVWRVRQLNGWLAVGGAKTVKDVI